MLKNLTIINASFFSLFSLFIFCDCRSVKLSNPCDPTKLSSDTIFIKLILGEGGSSCGSSAKPSTISGTISGLLSSGLILQNNGAEDQTLSSGATGFTFPTKVIDYLVTVKTQPRFHNCIVNSGSGRASSDVANVLITCSPKQAGYLIVSNVTSANISVYSINSTSGILSQIAGSPFSTGTCFPRGLSLSPDSNFVYAACEGENKIRAYSVSRSSGSLSQISGSPFSVPSGAPTRVSVDPSGKWLVLGTNNPSTSIHMYSLNSSTGAATFLASYSASGAQPYAVTFDSLGKFVYAGIGSGVNTGRVDGWSLNTTTGALTSVGAAVAGGANAIEIATDPTGRYLYAANYSSPGRIFVYTINPTSGVLAQIAGLGSGFSTTDQSPDSLLVDPLNRFVYAGNQTPSTLAGFTIDSTTGGLTAISGMPLAGFSGALAMDPSGKYLFTAIGGNVRSSTVNSTTGVPTLIGSVSAGTDQTQAVVVSY